MGPFIIEKIAKILAKITFPNNMSAYTLNGTATKHPSTFRKSKH